MHFKKERERRSRAFPPDSNPVHCSQTVGIGHSNVRIKKNQLCVVDIVAMCSYSEISTCGLDLDLGLEDLASEFWPRPWPWPRRFGLV